MAKPPRPSTPTAGPSPGLHLDGASPPGASTRSKLRRSHTATPSNPHIHTDDADAWDDNSDDEATVAKMKHSFHPSTSTSPRQQSHQASLSTPSTSSATLRPEPPPPPQRSSSWSFNPFNLLSVATSSLSSAASTSRDSSTPPARPGPEAVAAVLNGSPIPNTPPALAPPVKDPAGKEAGSEVEPQVDEPPDVRAGPEPELSEAEAEEATRKKESWQMDQWKAALKPNVEELVRDPVSLLERLNAPSPVSPTGTPRRREHRASISSQRSAQSEDDSPASPPPNRSSNSDDSDDEAALGYVPLNALSLSSANPRVVEFGEGKSESAEEMRTRRRGQQFIKCLEGDMVDLAELRKLSWAGIPPYIRPMVWQLLLGYLPSPSARRIPTLARKRLEYATAVSSAFSRPLDPAIWHQIAIDVPRTHAGVPLWRASATQRALERVLYVWAIRHPASGYVQGINDLVTPFFEVFLGSYIDTDPESYDLAALPQEVADALEADAFWCLSKLLDGIQDNYIFAQPGIVRQVAKMRELCSRVDSPLAYHLEEQGVEFMQFAFRWVNCLLMRELSVRNIIRMWDTYLAEGADAFSEFHLYVCLAFLVKWSEQLRGMDFQAIIMFLQSLPTQTWSDKDTELLLSEAFMWSRTFEAR